jgi:pimeloyl-ACP methyl ester carboxylesterase
MNFSFPLLLFFVFALSSFNTEVKGGNLVQYVKMGTLKRQEITHTMDQYDMSDLPAAQYDVDLYKITYLTPSPHRAETKVSGIVALPIKNDHTTPSPMIVYSHGTMTDRNAVPSNLTYQIKHAITAFASGGYVVAASDYIGLGDSVDLLHPYCHSESLATTGVDTLRAAKQLAKIIDYPLEEKIYLTGYSEGGLATLATHHLVESKLSDEFQVAASAPMAGPYELSECTLNGCLDNPAKATTMYLTYVLLAYNYIYGDVFDRISEVFKPPYDSLAARLFDGTQSPITIREILPNDPKKLLKDEFVSKQMRNPEGAFYKRLKENDRYDWAPRAPTMFIAAAGDIDVAFSNTTKTFEHMKSLEGNVNYVDVGEQYGHMTGRASCMVKAREYFDRVHSEGK